MATALALAPTSSSPAPAKEAMTKLDAQLTCSVCLDRYVDPRVLTCHHSFCKDCIGLIPQEREQGKLVVKCPCCREPTQLSEKGTSTLPVAFHINNLLEIDEMFKKIPAREPHTGQMCTKHDRSLDLFCETCDEFICFICGKDSHQQHQYDCAGKVFEKNVCEIKSCLKPVNDQILEVAETISLFDVVDKMIQDQSEIVKENIIQTMKKIANELERRKENLLQQVDRATLQKIQLNSLKRDEVKKVLAELHKCNELVVEELKSRSPYQLQSVKKSLVQLISDTRMKVKMNELQPDQEPDTRFALDEVAYSLGNVVSSLNCQAACDIVSVNVPSQAFAGPGQVTCIPVMIPISISPEQVTTDFFSLDNPCQEQVLHPPVVQIDDGHFVICLQPSVTGLHEFNVDINGFPVKGSPFKIPILPSAEMREQGLDVVASGLKCPYNSVVTADSQYIVIVEQDGDQVTILTTSAGQVVRQFGSRGQGPGYFTNPHSVVVSSSNHIFVADLHSIQKFMFSGSHVATVSQSVRGLAFHPSGRLLAIAKSHTIKVFNLELSHSHSFGDSGQLVDACDLAVDTKGMVYVVTIKHGIHKFSSDLKQHVASIEIKDQLNFCLMGICIDAYDNIYVTDVGDNEKPVIMLNTEGELMARFGNRRHQFHGITVNKMGDLFVCYFSAGELLVYRA